MSAKKKVNITLKDHTFSSSDLPSLNDRPYQVIEATNTVEWRIGEYLTKEYVKTLLETRPTLTIKII